MILSLFPGIDLLGKAFQQEGFNVVTGPDILWGSDIRDFNSEPDIFEGIIAGSPCPDFSLLRRTPPTLEGMLLLSEFVRVVMQSRPDWWLLENVATVPNVEVPGYSWQRIDIDQCWYDEYSRLRHFQFGHRWGKIIFIPRKKRKKTKGGCAVANDKRTFKELCHIQGLGEEFDLPSFNLAGKKRAVGNGVPLSMGREVAKAIKEAYHLSPGQRLCNCQCGRIVTGRYKYYSAACRKRAERERAARRPVVGAQCVEVYPTSHTL